MLCGWRCCVVFGGVWWWGVTCDLGVALLALLTLAVAHYLGELAHLRRLLGYLLLEEAEMVGVSLYRCLPLLHLLAQ